MIIKLISEVIALNTTSESNLSLNPICEAFIMLRDQKFEVDEPNSHGQVFLKEYDIWINKYSWIEIKSL